jgi:hypothetical protein
MQHNWPMIDPINLADKNFSGGVPGTNCGSGHM